MKRSGIQRGLGLATMLAVTLSGGFASAQEVSLASQDASVPGGALLLICYMVLWVMIGGYVFFVMRRQKALADDLERLESRLDEVLGTGTAGDV